MNCNRCSLWDSNSYVSGEGPKDAKLAVIGESPGNMEIAMGAPFVGESGGLLNWFLRKSGIIKSQSDRIDEVWVDNVIRCFPTEDLSIKHLQACRHKFANKLYKIKPKIIIAMGPCAVKSVLKNYSGNIRDLHSFWQYSDEFNCWVMPTFHPAKVLRNWGDTSIVLRNFEKVYEALKSGVPEQKVGKHYVTANNISKVEKLFEFLNSKKRVAFDLESTSAKYYEDSEDIIGFSFSWKIGYAAWLPLFGQGRRQIWEKSELRGVLKLVREFLENKDVKKDGANIKFDINFCKTIGITVRGVDFDIMQFHHLIDENTPANLTYLTSYYGLNFPRYEDEIKEYVQKHPTIKKSKTYEYIPDNIIAKYACADADATFRISKIQRNIATERQKNLYYALSVELSKISSVMEYRGALIDVSRIGELEKEYEVEINKKSTKFSKLCNVKSINVQSPPQIQKLLFDTLKFKSTVKTKTGNPSTGKDTIDLLKRDTTSKKKIKILNYITEIRGMRKLKSTYLTGFKEIVDKNNRLHTNYLTTGTVTGRPASVSPNLQNCLSKKDTEVLTERGWKWCGQINVGDKIATYYPDSDVLRFRPVLEVFNIKSAHTTRFYKEFNHYDMTVTDDHRIYFRNKNGKGYVVRKAETFLKDAKIINSAVLKGRTLEEDINILRFAIMLNHDGWIHADNCGLGFMFVRPRKIRRFLWLTKKLKLTVSENKPRPYSSKRFPSTFMRRFYVPIIKNWNFCKRLERWVSLTTKELSWDLLSLQTKLRKKVFEEYFHWDGSYTKKTEYLSKNNRNVDIFQALGISLGYRVTKSIREVGGRLYPVANVCRRSDTTTANTIVEDGGCIPVWCCTVKTGAFLVRSCGSVFVTGNCPRNPTFRSLFIAGKNRRLVVADYSQVEDRLMAFFAGEKHLLEKYQDAKFDPHTLTSAAVRKKKPEDVTKEERSFDKAIKFGMNYGRSAKSIAETYEMKIEEVEAFMRNYFKSHPAISKYRNKSVRLSKRGYLENIDGRRRHFSAYEWLYSPEMNTVRELRESCGDSNWVLDSIESGMERQALNFPIQSAAFGQMILGMSRVRGELRKRKLYDSHLIMQIYDAVIIDCPKKDAKVVEKIVRKFLPFKLRQERLKMDVNFPADITVAKFWDQ